MSKPPFYATPEELEIGIEEYFSDCDSAMEKVVGKGHDGETIILEVPAPKRYTMAGLCYSLGFAAKNELSDMAKDKPEYSAPITRAKLKIESQRSGDLVHPDTRNANGIKFDLTNNFGWKETSDLTIKKDDPMDIYTDEEKAAMADALDMLKGGRSDPPPQS